MRKKPGKVGYGTVSLPTPLIDKIKDRMDGTGLTSVSSYVAFVLRQVLSSDVVEGQSKGRVIDKASEEDLKKRLKSLGYD